MARRIEGLKHVWRYNIRPTYRGEYDAVLCIRADTHADIYGRVFYSVAIGEYGFECGSSRNDGRFVASSYFANAKEIKAIKRTIAQSIGVGYVLNLKDIETCSPAFQMLFPKRI